MRYVAGMISLRRLVGAAVLIAATATFPFTGAQAATHREASEPLLCESDDGLPDVEVKEFPYVIRLEESGNYPDGVRTCNFSGKRTIVYMCDGSPDNPPPVLNVISNVDRGRRALHRAVCDGKYHTIEARDSYKDRNAPVEGPYHAHWHLSEASRWNSAYLEIK